MEKLIYQLNSSIDEWLNKNGFNCKVEYAKAFNYNYSTRIISYNISKDIVQDKLFLEICRSIYCDIDKYNYIIILFLHELGYNMTQNLVTSNDIEEAQRLKSIENPTEDEHLAYFISFLEWEAINWACEYIKKNSLQIDELSNIIEDSKYQNLR